MSDLSAFLSRNPWSKIEETEISEVEGSLSSVVMPWGDDSLQIVIPSKEEERERLHTALNSVILPKRLSALYHWDERRLEVIWTALKIASSSEELANREFAFCFMGRQHNCRFSDSTTSLLQIARCAVPVGQSDTNFRNLISFNRYASEDSEASRERLFGRPRSFFIDNVDYDEERIVELCENLNFYMSYYDYATPRVLIHDDIEVVTSSSRLRYRTGAFPSHIDATQIDENLLSFWSESFSGNEILQFMLHFRIMEYASSSYAADNLRRRVLRAVSRPDVRANPGRIADEIVEFLNASDTKVQDDHSRFMNTIRENVSPEVLWAEIEKDKLAFSIDKECDGGFSLNALIEKSATLEQFRVKGVENFARQIREIRNVLSHGKDFPREGVFRPTRRNLRLLRPWVSLMALASGEVVQGRVSR